MPREFTLPDLGEGIAEAQVIRLMIKPGDQITEDQYLLEVETDKAAVEIPSPYAGIAREVHVKEGETINVGDVIVTFDDGNGSAPASRKSSADVAAPPADESSVAPAEAPPAEIQSVVAAPSPRTAKTVAAAPVVRKMAREMGVDLTQVTGSGPGGRITKEDVQRESSREESALAPRSAPSGLARSRPEAAAGLPGVVDTDKWGTIRREPLRQIRKTIAAQMTRSAFTIPHVTHVDEADITELDRMRRHLNEATGGDPKLTAMSFLIRAVCLAMRDYPSFNASFDEEGEQMIYKEYVNMGVAVDTQRGLIVPVIRNADQLSLRGIATALRGIAEQIRSSRFAIEDLRGGTFTITNVGALGGLFSTPIINHPEVAILGLGRSHKVPVLLGDRLGEVLRLPLCLSFDHRATDGANAARFTREIISYLETPAKFLLD